MTTTGPRQYLVRPRLFGKTRAPTWYAPEVTGHTGPDRRRRAELAVAYYQHQVIFAVLEAMRLWETDCVALFAEKYGENADNMRRKFRGERWASLEDMLAWTLHAGIDLLPVRTSAQGYLPPPELLIEREVAHSPVSLRGSPS
ncbi:MAG: hypothetical protein M0Z69_14670 [Actinomycetota bacterium]|nr:hypothetical protein [Actinomycetota bacterium]